MVRYIGRTLTKEDRGNKSRNCNTTTSYIIRTPEGFLLEFTKRTTLLDYFKGVGVIKSPSNLRKFIRLKEYKGYILISKIRINEKKVFALGVFDMLHIAHINLLKKARTYGRLVVGIVRDYPVSLKKGKDRPIIKENERRKIVDSLECVNKTMLLWDFYIPKFVIKNFDYIIVGGDQTHIKNLDDIPKEKRIDLPRTEGVSTSDIVKRLKEN